MKIKMEEMRRENRKLREKNFCKQVHFLSYWSCALQLKLYGRYGLITKSWKF